MHDRSGDRGDGDPNRLLGVLDGLPAAERRGSDPREAVIVAHLPLVERLAKRFARSDVTRDDLVQAGAIGLILAVDRFDARRGVPFTAYAIPTIVGSIQRYLRDTAPIIRTTRRRAGAASAHAETGYVGCPQRTKPVIDAVHVALLGDWQDLETRPSKSSKSALLDPELENVTERQTVAHYVLTLGPRDRQLIYLRFYEDESLAQIADQMNLSVPRVSRLLTRALATLHDKLAVCEDPT